MCNIETDEAGWLSWAIVLVFAANGILTIIMRLILMRLMVLLNSIMIIIGKPDENDFIIHNDSLNKSHQP
jgi:hypothetical protein